MLLLIIYIIWGCLVCSMAQKLRREPRDPSCVTFFHEGHRDRMDTSSCQKPNATVKNKNPNFQDFFKSDCVFYIRCHPDDVSDPSAPEMWFWPNMLTSFLGEGSNTRSPGEGIMEETSWRRRSPGGLFLLETVVVATAVGVILLLWDIYIYIYIYANVSTP